METMTALRRRNSISSPILSNNLNIPNKQQSSSFPATNNDKSSFPTVDLELLSLKPLPYTSLKDLLPSLSSVQSPTGASSHSIYEIPIRNHLVKQAAWAYLQPMSSSPSSSSGYSFRRLWVRFSSNYLKTPITACFGFITYMFDQFLGAIRVKITTRR